VNCALQDVNPIGNRSESRERTAPSELVTAYQRNELNQYPRGDTTGPAARATCTRGTRKTG
jgi:hypothetical protein